MTHEKCPEAAVLFDYAVGRLSDADSDSVAAHLDACPICQAELETVEDADDTLVRRLRQPIPEEPYLDESDCHLALARAKAVAGEKGGRSNLPERPEGCRAQIGPVPFLSLGEYQLLKRLGRGGMGTVYQALHTKLDRMVALKILPKGRLEDRQAVARFEREMKAAARLDHPNIVQAYDAREIDDMPVLIMQYVEGMDLGELLRRLGRLPVADACELARQAALALQYAHENGLVHRDVKPSNLMLTPQGELKLLDLGLARFYLESPAGGEVTDTGQAMGTADYMAPEQVSSSRQVDIRADVYSLGCTLYKLLSGRAPFSGPEYPGKFEKMTAHVETPAPPIGEQVPEVPAALAGLLDRMLAKDPDGRPAAPAEVVESLEPFCPGHDLASLVKQAEQSEPSDRDAADQAQPAPGDPVVSPSSPAAAARRAFRLAVAIGLMLLSFVLGFALGILVTISRNGDETQVVVPVGSKVNIDEQGNVHVTLPPGTKVVTRGRAAPAAQSDERAIQGTWQFVAVTKQGQQKPEDEVEIAMLVLADGHFGLFDLRREQFETSGSYVLDLSRTPKQIDLEDSEQGRTLPGIYQLEGDRLQVCLNDNEGEPVRPTEFVSEEDSPNETLIELRRVGDAEAALQLLERLTERPGPHDEEAEAVNDLKQIGLAMHSFHDTWKRFPPAVLHHEPPGTLPGAGGPPRPSQPYSWRVALLPYLGQQPLFEQYRFDEPWDSPANKKVLQQMPDVYRHPEDPAGSTNTAYLVLTGPGTIFDDEDGSRIRDIPDGTFNTILAVEAKREIPWTKPEDIPFHPEKPLPELGGFAPGGFHAVLADGSTRFILESMDEDMLRAAIQKADGQQKVVWPESPPAFEPKPSPEAGAPVSSGTVSPLFQPRKPPQGSRGSAY